MQPPHGHNCHDSRNHETQRRANYRSLRQVIRRHRYHQSVSNGHLCAEIKDYPDQSRNREFPRNDAPVAGTCLKRIIHVVHFFWNILEDE
jgi:hypothetical protein